jgi:hypothetical protein
VAGAKPSKSVRIFKKTHSQQYKITKTMGVKLPYERITRAMFMVPGLRARPPIRKAIFKKMYTYHLDMAAGW